MASDSWPFEIGPLFDPLRGGHPYLRVTLGQKPKGYGRMLLLDAKVINPILGAPSANFVGDLNAGQLKALAATWVELCEKGYKAFGDAEDVTGVLVESGEVPSAYISRAGEIFIFGRYGSAALEEPPEIRPDELL